MSTILDQDYLTVADAAERLRVEPATIRRWIEAGDLTTYRFGRHSIRVKRAELERLTWPSTGASGWRCAP